MASGDGDPLAPSIAAYEALQPTLEKDYRGKWVLFHAGEFIDAFGDFATADARAIEEFDDEPCLIRKVGEGPAAIPSSILFGANGIS